MFHVSKVIIPTSIYLVHAIISRLWRYEIHLTESGVTVLRDGRIQDKLKLFILTPLSRTLHTRTVSHAIRP